MFAIRLAVASLLITGPACGASSEPAADAPPPTATTAEPSAGTKGAVLVLGDSLTEGALVSGHLDTALRAEGWAPEVVAQSGQDVSWGLDQVRARSAVPPVVVVGLGTNPGPRPDEFAADAAALVDELLRRGATTVVWIPPASAGDEGRARRAAALRATAGRGLVVPDWPAELARHPERVAADGIHLTDDGYRHLAGFVVQALGT